MCLGQKGHDRTVTAQAWITLECNDNCIFSRPCAILMQLKSSPLIVVIDLKFVHRPLKVFVTQ